MNAALTDSETARAYCDPPEVTEAREARWHAWIDDYALNRARAWMSEGSSYDDALHGAAAVLADWYELDGVEWMPLGAAMELHLEILLNLDGRRTEERFGDERLEYMKSVRTLESATTTERAHALSFRMGISVRQARELLESSEGSDAAEIEAAHEVDTALYRYFDSDDVLLYVGITSDPQSRDYQHQNSSAWHQLASRKRVEWFDSRSEALIAERQAIRDETPLFNATHSTQQARRKATEYLIQCVARAEAAS